MLSDDARSCLRIVQIMLFLIFSDMIPGSDASPFVSPCVGPELGTANRSRTSLKIGFGSRLSNRIVSSIAGIVLHEMLGYSVEYVDIDESRSDSYWADISSGLYDVDLEQWGVDPLGDQYGLYVKAPDAQVVDAGRIGYAGRAGLYAFRQVVTTNRHADYFKFYQNGTKAAQAGVRTFSDTSLAAYLAASVATSSPAELCNIQEYAWCGTGTLEGHWAPPTCLLNPSTCVEIIKASPAQDLGRIEQLIRNNLVQAVVGYYGSDIDALADHLQSLETAREMPLFYWWEPSALLLQVEAVRVSFPDFTSGCEDADTQNPETGKVACDVPEAAIHKLVSRRLREEAQEAYYFISRFQLDGEAIRTILQSTHAGGGPHATAANAACHFVRNNSKQIQDWAPRCLTHPGQQLGNRVVEVFNPRTEMCENRIIYAVAPATKCFAQSAAPGKSDHSDITIRIKRRNWVTHALTATIAEVLLRDYLGYNAEVVLHEGYTSYWGDEFIERVLDLEIESWSLEWGTWHYERYVGGGHVRNYGALGYTGRSGVYIPEAALSRDVHSDYYKFYRNASKAAALGWVTHSQSRVEEVLGGLHPQCSPAEFSWCNSSAPGYWVAPPCDSDPGRCLEILLVDPWWDTGYIERLSKNNGLEVVVAYAGWDLWTLVTQYLDAGQMVAFYWFSPDTATYQINETRVSFPDYSLGCDLDIAEGYADPNKGTITCDFQEFLLAKVGNAWLGSLKDVSYAVSRLEIQQKDLDQLLPDHTDAGGTKSSEELACDFFRRNDALVREWVPACLTDPPPAGQANIGDSVFLPDEERCVELACPPDQILEYQHLTGTYTCRPCGSAAQVPDATQQRCILCGAGEEVNLNRTSCTPCSAGSFALPRSGTCLPCPVGSFTSSEGQSQCISCGTGTYQNLTGQRQCLDCPLGTSAPTESLEQCVPCAAGTIAPERGLAACQECEPGTYQRRQGGSSCTPCNPGSYAVEAASLFCLECLPGFFQPNSSASQPCSRCPLGTFTEIEGSTGCSACALGTTTQAGADSRWLCQCPRHTFLLTTTNGTTTDEACMPCNKYMEPCSGFDSPAFQKQGFWVSSDGQQVFRCVSATACPGGLVGSCPRGSTGSGCAECEQGAFFWNGAKCEKCHAGDVLAVAALPMFSILSMYAIYKLGNDPVGHRFSAMSEFLVLVGLGLNIILYLNSLAAFDVSWQDPVDFIMEAVRSLTVELLRLNFSCSVSTGHVKDYLLTSLLPLLIICVCTLLALAKVAAKKKMFNTFATCGYGLYLPLLLHALKPFRFVVHPDGRKSVFDMPSIADGSDEHLGLIVVGTLVLLLYCVPFALACMWAAVSVAKARHNSTRRWLLGTFRFLFYKFRPQTYYWGVCILLRNIAFAVAPSIAPEEPKIGLWILSFTSALGAVHTAFMRPWRFLWMNIVDVGILCFILLALCLAASWLPDGPDADEILATAMLFIAFIAGVCGACCSLWLLLQVVFASQEQREAVREERLRMEEMHVEQMLKISEGKSEDDDVAGLLDSLSQSCSLEGRSQSANAGLPSVPAWTWVSRQEVDKKLLHSIARSIRVIDYRLEDYYKDCMQVFPELQLYLGADAADNSAELGRPARLSWIFSRQSRTSRSSRTSGLGAKPLKTSANNALLVGGRTSAEEQKRTIGALFAVYCLCRLDIDGKEIMSFGVDETCLHKVNGPPSDVSKEDLKSRPWGKLSPQERQAFFYYHFDWDLMKDLFIQAGILVQQGSGGPTTVDSAPGGRLIAMLSLTAYHDIMKDRSLCPTVEGEAYGGVEVGEVIGDHDLALAYVLDRHPEALPSFRVLTTEQRRAVRFTQSEMGFNAGWLVQAEGPPSAVLSKIKKAITRGEAPRSDVAFYFVHWVTDLAGAEPTPFKGSEKFAVKFPPPILQGLLSCFAVVETLAERSETEVYEAYIMQRWQDSKVKDLHSLQPDLERVAKWRLHCMAQQHAGSMLEAWAKLPAADRHLLTHELAATGLPGQEFQDWTRSANGLSVGTPFLLYYGPAWCQRIGGSHPVAGLQILADILRLGREAFPESVQFEKDQEAGIMSRTLEVGFLKTIALEDFIAVYNESGRTCMTVQVRSRTEAVVEANFVDC